MPKETIHDVTGTFDVRVGWLTDGHVQVGVEQAAGFSLLTQLYGYPESCESIGLALIDRLGVPVPQAAGDADKSAALREIGRAVLDAVEASGNSPDGSYSGVWSTLDRGSINRLIRVLRRARDQAFGRDE